MMKKGRGNILPCLFWKINLKNKKEGQKMKNNRFVAAILVPGFLLLFVFSIFPLFYGLGISFFDYNPVNSTQPFLGLENYKRMFQDEVFYKADRKSVV